MLLQRAAHTVGVSSPIRLAGKLAKPGRTEPSLVAPVGSQLQRLQHIFDVRWFDGARLRRQRRHTGRRRRHRMANEGRCTRDAISGSVHGDTRVQLLL